MTEPLIELGQVALNCLSMAVTGAPNPPGEMCFRVGMEVVHDLGQFVDLCCTGLGYVSMGDTYPSSMSFPEADIVRQASSSCGPPGWGQQIRMGIIRCAPTGDLNGEPPTCADWTDAFIQNAYDAGSLRRASCCFRQWIINSQGFYEGMSVVIERQIQQSPAGGCVERYVTLAVQFPNCDC